MEEVHVMVFVRWKGVAFATDGVETVWINEKSSLHIITLENYKAIRWGLISGFISPYSEIQKINKKGTKPNVNLDIADEDYYDYLDRQSYSYKLTFTIHLNKK